MSCDPIPLFQPKRKVLDLFSGIGGFSLGLERTNGFETAAFCEIDPVCRRVLAKHWPETPIHHDVKQLDGNQYAGSIDLICGGYPCQPFSVAGNQNAERDPRHLWPHMLGVIRDVRPRWVICENVTGHVKLGFDTVAAQLEAEGFTVWPFLVPASAVGAPHGRERLWIVGYAEHHGRPSPAVGGGLEASGDRSACRPLTSRQPQGAGEPGGGQDLRRVQAGWPVEPDIIRFDGEYLNPEWVEWLMGYPAGWTGLAPLKERLKMLGNTVVPQIPQLIGHTILGFPEALPLAA